MQFYFFFKLEYLVIFTRYLKRFSNHVVALIFDLQVNSNLNLF